MYNNLTLNIYLKPINNFHFVNTYSQYYPWALGFVDTVERVAMSYTAFAPSNQETRMPGFLGMGAVLLSNDPFGSNVQTTMSSNYTLYFGILDILRMQYNPFTLKLFTIK